MRVTEDQQLYRGVLDQLLLGPRPLPRRCRVDRRSVNAVLAQPRGKPMNQGEAKLGMEGAIYCRGGSARDQPLEQSGKAARVPEPVTVDCQGPPATGGEFQPVRRIAEAHLTVPEIEPPPVVIATHHEHRQAAAESGERGGYAKSMTRHHAAVGKPELEQVAVHQ
jgi:hypothetical protein